MCKQNAMLVQLNVEKFIACCEHGTLHIHWLGTVFCVMPGGLAQMVQILERVDDSQTPIHVHQHNLTLTRLKRDCHYQLRLGTVMLIITIEEFTELLKLLKTAWQKFLQVAPNLHLSPTQNFNKIGIFHNCVAISHN